MKRACIVTLTCTALAMTAPFKAHGAGGDLAGDLRQNVVRITAARNGTLYDGFGFIIANRDGVVYIATADHVVRGDGPDAIDQTPKVAFFSDQGAEYPAELLGTRLAPGEGDVAILRLKAPAGLRWRPEALAPDRVRRGASVWFVGLQRDWHVPIQPGSINRIEPNGVIVAEGLNVRVGTSGAPLISETGIIGMVIADAETFVRATPIEVIERAVREVNYPWELTAVQKSAERRLPPPPPPPDKTDTPTPPPPQPRVSAVHDCDRLAARPDDPFKPAQVPGVGFKQINVITAIQACRQAVETYGTTPRFAFQLGRAYRADHKIGEASVWFRRAADAGYPVAQYALGTMYEEGRNDVEAVRRYRLAAQQGFAGGHARVGFMYLEGRGGLPRNDVVAVRFFQLAVEKGNSLGQRYLGRMYEEGRGGLRRNFAEAMRLYQLAAAQGDERARELIDGLRNMQGARRRVPWD